MLCAFIHFTLNIFVLCFFLSLFCTGKKYTEHKTLPKSFSWNIKEHWEWAPEESYFSAECRCFAEEGMLCIL